MLVETKSFFESFLEIDLLLLTTVTLVGVLVECRPVPHFTGHFELKIENLCRGQLLATELDSAVFDVVESSAPIYLVSVP